MMGRKRRLIVAAPLVMTACVRWGVPDDEGFADDYDYTTDEWTTASSGDPDGSSGGESTTTTTTTTAPVEDPVRTFEEWPEQWPFDPNSRLVVWGKSRIPTVNLEMFANIFHHLAGVAPGEVPLSIVWLDDCDPRIDPDGCMLGDVRPFFEMVDSLGTIEFTTAIEEMFDYDVVIADFCGPVDSEQFAALLASGVGVLALGDGSCATPEGTSAKVANETLPHYGVRFRTRDLDVEQYEVPAEEQIDVLEGVVSLDVLDVQLQRTIDPSLVALETPDGIVLSSRSES